MKEFEDLIDEIGGQGWFQKRLLYVVLAPLFFFLPLSWLNEIFLLHTPRYRVRIYPTELLLDGFDQHYQASSNQCRR